MHQAVNRDRQVMAPCIMRSKNWKRNKFKAAYEFLGTSEQGLGTEVTLRESAHALTLAEDSTRDPEAPGGEEPQQLAQHTVHSELAQVDEVPAFYLRATWAGSGVAFAPPGLEVSAQSPTSGVSVVASSARSRWIENLFWALDIDHDGVLDSEEMRLFADQTGFDGTDTEWKRVFARLQRKCGVLDGVPLSYFVELVNGTTSGIDIALNDDELKVCLVEFITIRSGNNLASTLEARAKLIVGLFEYLDRDGDGLLSSSEMRTFAAASGFTGTDADWKMEFDSLCSSYAIQYGTSDCVSLAFLAHMVNDLSDDGCYCSDDELRALVVDVGSPA